MRSVPVEIRHDDYRAATGTFDAVVSIGLMEHVGPKNYRGYMELVDRTLAPGGVAFVHTICGNRVTSHIEPWFDKYIFPNAVLPTPDAIICMDSANPTCPTTSPRSIWTWNSSSDRPTPKLRSTLGPKADKSLVR